MTRWKKAAIYAKQVIDFKLNVDNVKNGFNSVNRVDWTDPNFPGIVYGSRYDNNNDAMERALYPGGFQGNGALGATQDLVDAFPMKNGYPKDHPEGAKLYDPKNPYANRDPRFYSVIFYNNSKANRDNNETKPMYTLSLIHIFRYSDGKVGSDSASERWLYIGEYSANGNYIYEDKVPNIYAQWEEARKRDLGIEMAFLDNMITVGVDFFDEKRTHMLLNPQSNTMLIGNNGFCLLYTSRCV